MDSINTPEELLAHLAARGDPTAFATLVASRARAAYVSLRNAGKSHADALEVLEPFLRKLHTAFRRKPEHVSFEEWYGNQMKRHLRGGLNSGEGVENTPVPETVAAADLSDFESQMRLALQRNYGRMMAGGGAAAGRIVSFVNARSLLKAGAAALITLAATAAVLYGWMTFAHASVTVIVSTAGRQRSIELPMAINRRLFRLHPVVNPPDSHVVKSGNAAPAADSQHTVAAGPVAAGDSLAAHQQAGKTISQRLPAGNSAPLAGKKRPPARKRAPVPSDSLNAAGGSAGTSSSPGEIKKNLSESPPAQGGSPSSPADTSAAGK